VGFLFDKKVQKINDSGNEYKAKKSRDASVVELGAVTP
jgi:hypothetical protein